MVSLRKCPDCKLCEYHKHKFNSKAFNIAHVIYIVLLIISGVIIDSPSHGFFVGGYISFWIVSLVAVAIENYKIKKYKK